MEAMSSGVAARGSTWKRRLGIAEAEIAGVRGGLAICSRPPWKSWTKRRVPCGRTASATPAKPATDSSR
jgi:hypothetical protein